MFPCASSNLRMTRPQRLPGIWERALEALIDIFSFILFKVLDRIDRILCIIFQLLDWAFDGGRYPCYCHLSRDARHQHLEQGVSKELHADTHLEADSLWNGVSDSLHNRDHIKSEHLFSHINFENAASCHDITPLRPLLKGQPKSSDMKETIIFILNHFFIFLKMKARNITSIKQDEDYPSKAKARWSDCGCKSCTDLQLSTSRMLYVVQSGRGTGSGFAMENDILFLHGFLSSSSFWVDRVFPYLSESIQKSYRLFAVDLLGFGKSPKPSKCLYTLADHVETIRKSILEPYGIKCIHLVGHSMGCTVALALAAEFPKLVKSVTLISPPYFAATSAEMSGLHVLRQVAPKKIWPLISFGSSVMSWYEHIGRVVCFVICKNHQLWEPPLQLLARIVRIPRCFVQDFMQHTHHSAWHVFHNTICGAAYNIDRYLKILADFGCEVTIIHGREDYLCPVNCSYQLQAKYPKVQLNIIENAGHHAVVADCKYAIAKQLEGIWTRNLQPLNA
ncbi:hypothetical protein O6H91_16G070500 [Diphasiastrum complanatum]|uniref:Uncharacterized protein n=1 Tax=Diphasiastrum complanatum TaxID=34168 RepID=A0ACC2BDB6_DIPCM|nr:hypothetical protein O6H91_16G070500 [Diphasiastrum complanatum]